MFRQASLIALAILLLSVPSAATGSTAAFSGYVRSTAGWPIAAAEVVVGRETVASAQTVITNAAGYYSIDVPAAADYTVLVKAPGYESQDRTMLSPSAQDFALTALASGYLVETINQGWKHYLCPQWETCYRTDGQVVEGTTLFPDIEADSPAIAALLAAIGAGTDTSEDDAQIWQKAKTLWDWLKLHASSNYGDPTWEQANQFLLAQGWPSIERMAQTYHTYGFLPWGTCMSRAQMFTTLLFRTGVPKERLGIAETRWQLRYSQHMYTILYLAGRWIHLDPVFNEGHDFPDWDQFCSIPRAGYPYIDYLHPLGLTTIPSSSLDIVPAVTRRSADTRHILITQPPDGSLVVSPDTLVTGQSEGVAQILLNGADAAMVWGTFAIRLDLSIGANTIAAQLTVGSSVFSDAVSIVRVVMPTPAPTHTATQTPSPSATPSATRTPTSTATQTPSPSATPSATQTPTATATNSPTPTRTSTPTCTPTPSVTPTHVPTIPGDLDGDCDVDVVDIMLVACRWSAVAGDANYNARYDLDHDGDIDVADIMLVACHWGQSCSGTDGRGARPFLQGKG